MIVGDINNLLPTSSAAKLLRLARVFRVARLFRVLRYVAPLRLMVRLILRSFKLLIWVFVLFFSVMYVFGICFTQGVADFVKADQHSGISSKLRYHYGSLASSIFTLWRAACGVVNWSDVV